MLRRAFGRSVRTKYGVFCAEEPQKVGGQNKRGVVLFYGGCLGGVSEQNRGGFVLRAGWKATAAGIYGLRLLLTKRCGRLSPRAVLALDRSESVV